MSRKITQIYSLSLLRCILLLLAAQALQAQGSTQPVAAPATTDTAKRYVLKARFGPFTGAGPVLLTDLIKLVDTKLIVTDQEGTVWPVYSFRFGWTRKESSDDWRTGKRKIIDNYYATQVNEADTLPRAWKESLKESLKAGETIGFEQIIVENPRSKVKRLVPDLLLTIIQPAQLP
jgi:hypothetical protein